MSWSGVGGNPPPLKDDLGPPAHQPATRGCFIYILDSSNPSSIIFELFSSVLALKATEPVSEPVTQMAIELINNHLVSVQQNK